MRRTFFVAPFLLLALVATNAAAESKEDDSDVTDAQKAKAAFGTYSAKMKAALSADPRVKKLVKQAEEIRKVKDKVERKKKFQALAPQIAAIRADAIKKAGIIPKDAEDKIKAVKPKRVLAAKPMFSPGAVISTIKVTSFPTPYGNKLGCPDEDDKYDFSADKKTVAIWAQSAIADDDCFRIRAGRTATVQIPKHTKTVKVQFDAKVDIDVVSIAFGFWSEARAYVGLRVNIPGATFSVLKIAKGFPDVNIPSKTFELKAIYAQSAHIALWGLDDYENDMQEGEDNTTVTFALPPGSGTTMDLSPIVGGSVDADMQGFSSADLDLTIRSLKVTFMK